MLAMREFIHRYVPGALLALMPLTAAASVLPDPFVEGMQISAPVGQDFMQSYVLDPCGPVSNCYTTQYHTGAVISQADFDYPAVPGFFGLSVVQCGDGGFCADVYGSPETEGIWVLDFFNVYEARFYLGGDASGPEFVHTEERFLPHRFVLQATAPVPLPPAGLGMILGLVALAGMRRGRRLRI
jgi:hypothetical protein